MKFSITNTPVTKEGGVAAFKLVEKDGKAFLDPVWVSRDIWRGEPPIIANGMVFAWGSGDKYDSGLARYRFKLRLYQPCSWRHARDYQRAGCRDG